MNHLVPNKQHTNQVSTSFGRSGQIQLSYVIVIILLSELHVVVSMATTPHAIGFCHGYNAGLIFTPCQSVSVREVLLFIFNEGGMASFPVNPCEVLVC